MDWRDEGIILGMVKHGESAVVLEAFTRAHGRHKGYVHGALSKRRRGIAQPGNRVDLAWRGRFEDSLGTYTTELTAAYAAAIMAAPGPLAALRGLAAMLSRALPENDPHPGLYDHFIGLLQVLSAAAPDDPRWGGAVVQFECRLLAEIGYGLDLTRCATTGATEGLAYVSPRSGRAATVAGAGDFADRLLPLPTFLTGSKEADWPEVAAGLGLTGHFLERFFAESDGRTLPEERSRLAGIIAEKAARYGGVT